MGVVHRGLDLLGDLLVGAPGRSGLRWFAMGAGDPAWDANLPTPPITASSLTRELFRVPLTAANFTIDPVQRSITLKLTVSHTLIRETVREFGVFGGDATALPGSGYLFSYRIHPAIAPSTADLDRQVTLLFQVPNLADSGWLAIAELLTGQATAAPIAWWGEGSGDPAWDTALPASDPKVTALKSEVFRAPLSSRTELWYDAPSHTVVASLDLGFSDANAALRETALFNGADQPRLVAYAAYHAIDHNAPQRLHREFRLELSGDLTAKVPSLSGLTLAAAQSALATAGLVADPITQREDAAHIGRIVDFSPPAGVTVPVASRVALVVGVTPRVTVPNVAGIQPADAAAVLTARGLTSGDGGQDIVPEGGIPGSILRQQPAAGTVVDQGSTVLLTLGLPRMVAVPDLTGMNVQQAAAALDAAFLALAPAPYPTQESDAESGSIVLQNPAAGAQALRGSIVQVTFATYRTLEVPDLTGKTPADAQTLVQAASDAAAKALGRQAAIPWLTIGDTQGQDSDLPAGTVISQTPAPHARVSFYTAIHLIIAQAPLVTVPDVTGQKNMDAAGVILTKARLKPGVATPQPSLLPQGSIISQIPLAGVKAPAGSAVDLTVAAPILVTVPAIISLSIGSAGETIKGRGLVMGTPIPGVGTQPDGTVIAQTPAAGTSVATGSTVIPTVIQHIPVPNVVGQARAAAIATLQRAGFATINVTLVRSDQPVGIVLTQVPAGGSSAFAATAVALTVAQGQVLPNLVGTPATNLPNTMGSLNLRFDTVNQTSNQAVGTILKQDPAAGTEVPLGTLVHFTVAAGVNVPSVVGMTPDAAKAALAAAGLQIAVAGQGNIVAAQTPTPSQIVPLGTVVTVTLRATTVAAPDVRGKLSDAAIAALQAVGLGGVVATRVVNVAPANTVIAQDVAPGTVVNLGTTLKLTVSTGLIVIPTPVIPTPIG